MQNSIKTKIIISIFLIISTILMIVVPLISSEFSSTNFLKRSFAAAVQSCSPSETLSGNLCLTNRVSNPTYTLQCETGYTLSESACIQSIPKTCADYNNAINAEPGYCKYDPTKTLYGGQILDYDGRICRINGTTEMWFLRYNVTPLAAGATSGPIVCANVFQTSLVGGTVAAPNFRFIPANVNSIRNLVTVQTGSDLSPCPAGYTAYGTIQCSKPAINNSCNAGGEIAAIVNNAITCSPCPAGQYCQTTLNTNNQVSCTNGGTISSIAGVTTQKCLVTNLKYNYTSYSDGCATGYLTLDKTCAIKQIRDRDIDVCTYFFASSNVFQLAVADPVGSRICSTGGSTDFANTDIIKTDDTLTCAGPGSGWYNYNVAFDPLVCGFNTYDPNNKAAFRWSAETYTKITGLQKLPSTSKACPGGWTEVSSASSDCYQDPIILTSRTGTLCPANKYCPESTTNPNDCPVNYTSPAGSDALADCIPNPCTNGGTNPPACTCSATQTLVNSVCVANCTNGATNPPTCTNPSSSSVSSSSTSSSSRSSSSSTSSNNSTSSASSNANCTSAQPGYFVDGNKCSPCEAGYYCPGAKVAPIICPISYYCPAISVTPTLCPDGKTTKTTGSKSIAECVAITTVAAAPTPRSGGNQFLLNTVISIFTLVSLYTLYTVNRQRRLQEWKKIG
jgi:hypothetical protein